MVKVVTKLDRFFDLPNPSLRTILTRNEQGQPDDYRPPFWHGHQRAAVLAAWQKVVDSLGISKQYPWLYEFEMEMKAKVGPMSIMKPFKDREESVADYFTSVQLPSKPISDSAVDATLGYFSAIGGIRLRSQENTLPGMKLNTNSGAPLVRRRNTVIKETVPVAIEPPNSLFTPKYKGETAAIMFWRGQEGGPKPEDVKQRVVWGMPFGVNVCELQFYQPMIEACQAKSLIPAWNGNDAVDRAITKLFQTKGAKDDIVCTDFSKYDQHFNTDMQNVARKVEAHLLGGEDHPWIENVFPVKFNIPLVCTEAVSFEGPHGMGSGSGGTNGDETITHKSLQFEAAQLAHSELNEYSQCLGDDGLLSYPGIRVKDVIAAYTAHGQEMNESKQYVSNTCCQYLRCIHNKDYTVEGVNVGCYSTFRALGRLLAQERFYDPEKWGPEMVTLRAWSILENCRYNPMFHPFVDFVLETGDKYRLGLAIPGFITNVQKIADEAQDNFKDFLGYNRSESKEYKEKGLKDWEIYKYLATKEKR